MGETYILYLDEKLGLHYKQSLQSGLMNSMSGCIFGKSFLKEIFIQQLYFEPLYCTDTTIYYLYIYTSLCYTSPGQGKQSG